jgi:hypothetical protein
LEITSLLPFEIVYSQCSLRLVKFDINPFYVYFHHLTKARIDIEESNLFVDSAASIRIQSQFLLFRKDFAVCGLLEFVRCLSATGWLPLDCVGYPALFTSDLLAADYGTLFLLKL